MSQRRLQPWNVVLSTLLILTVLGCRNTAEKTIPVASGVVDEVAQVERSLLPAVRVASEPGWNLAERMVHHDVPGLSVAVIHDFELAWAKAYGLADRETGQPATTETLFQAASISKPVTATAVLAMVQEGSIELDTPVNDILRGWQLPDNELTAETPVTLRHLLSHTGGTTVHGFPGYAVDEDTPSLVQVLDGEPPANTPPIRVDIPPGSRFRYSGGGTTIVQQAIIDLSGRAFPDLMRENVLEPLGMSNSTYQQPLPPDRLPAAAAGHRFTGKPVRGKRHTYPEMAAAGLWTTPSDLARFAIAIQRAVRGHAGTFLSQETVNGMLTPVRDQVGLGLFVETRGDAVYFRHGGGNEGFRCFLIAHRDAGYGAAVMTNSDNGGALYLELLRAIAQVYHWQDYLPEPIEPLEIDPGMLRAYLGRYRFAEDLVRTVTLSGDRLLGQQSLVDEEPVWLIGVAEDTFIAQDTGLRIRFRLDDEGRATSIVNADDEEKGPVGDRLADEVTLPVELLAAGQTAEAVAAYRELGAAEERLNRLGYLLLRIRRTAQAIAIFRLNTELYPNSANTYDSLADAYLESEDVAQAAAAFRKVLATLPRDTAADPESLRTMRAKAEAYLARLEH